MIKKIFAYGLILCAAQALAQDDLLNMLQQETPAKPTPVYATFKSTRVINLQSNENMKAKHLDFRIQHRFGPIENGAYDLFGLDGAVIRLGFEYGITDRLMVGIGRSTVQKAYDGFVKYQLLQQQKNGMPIGLTLFGSTAINTIEWADPTRNNLFTSRLSYVAQAIVTRKMNDAISLLVSPTMVHYNLVPDKQTPNDVFAIGIGASIRLSRSIRFTAEYIPRLNGRDLPKQPNGDPSYSDAIAFGVDIETGGHVFQLHFTNATGLIEQQFIARNANPIVGSQLRFGFNISRTFSFDKH
ncbi:MAG: DUF5777 family beta-barrel protein [Bacteroidia bacterium]|jgi:hypothetical protein|nr:DUF5777 family beta-barrel protein [Bacteroidia bacterium]